MRSPNAIQLTEFDAAKLNRLSGEETEDPAEHQKLGRQFRGFSAYRWQQVRFDIVVRGNPAKFQQNRGMLNALLQTEHRTLVEASPRDTVWGIGLSASEPDAYEPSRWKGLNLLGRALMEVRSQSLASDE